VAAAVRQRCNRAMRFVSNFAGLMQKQDRFWRIAAYGILATEFTVVSHAKAL
jgi:hypothetical protein